MAGISVGPAAPTIVAITSNGIRKSAASAPQENELRDALTAMFSTVLLICVTAFSVTWLTAPTPGAAALTAAEASCGLKRLQGCAGSFSGMECRTLILQTVGNGAVLPCSEEEFFA